MQITVKRGRIVLGLGVIVTLLTVADAAVLFVKYRWGSDSLYGLTPLFDFNREGNLPAFYSACALLFAAVLFLVIAGDARERRDRWWRHWAGLGAIFVFLAVDEAAELHGLLSRPVSERLHTSGPLLFAWVIPYALLTLLVTFTYVRFLWALPGRTRWLMCAAAVVYVSGALGLELVGGSIVAAHGGVEHGLDVWQHALAYTLEELLEMLGVIIAIHALLEYIDERRIGLTLGLSAE